MKANPGKFSFAQPATGSTPHLNGELLKLEFGLDLAMVPFNGAAPAVTLDDRRAHADRVHRIAAGHVEHQGREAARARGPESRVQALPGVPTAAEAGISGHEGDTLTGIVVPVGTPREVIERLNAEIKRLVALPDVKEKLEVLGFVAVANRPEEIRRAYPDRERQVVESDSRRPYQDRIGTSRERLPCIV